MLYDRILNEHQRLQQQISLLENELESYPAGKLTCCHHKGNCKWYHSHGPARTYIPKSNRQLAEQLAAKKYLTYLLDDLKQEEKALAFYLRHHRPSSGHSEQLLQETSGYNDLLTPYFKLQSQELLDWMTEPYEKNPHHPENLIHKTSSGHLVRSKSEAMIAHFLYINHIPFRYECVLYLDNMILYPDFTIKHPQTGEIFYWEHFGLMNDQSYCRNMASKLQLYSTNGIIPSIQLITTFESQSNPLSIEMISSIIEYYFL